MRKYANLFTAIWADKDFVGLDKCAQATYFLLISQPDITAAGVLPLTERRWAKLSASTRGSDIMRDLEALESARFVFVDENTDEVLVRTFVKHDKGYGNPKRIPSVIDAVSGLRSPKLRMILKTEIDALDLSRIGTDQYKTLMDSLSLSLSDSHADSLSDRLSGGHKSGHFLGVSEGVVHPPVQRTHDVDEDEYLLGNRLSDSDTRSERLVVTAVPTDQQTEEQKPNNLKPSINGEKLISNSVAVLPLAALADLERNRAEVVRKKSTDVEAFDRFWNAYPRKVAKGAARKAFDRLAAKGTDLEAVITGAMAYRDSPIRMQGGTQYTAHPATWLNAERWLDDHAEQPAMSKHELTLMHNAEVTRQIREWENLR